MAKQTSRCSPTLYLEHCFLTFTPHTAHRRCVSIDTMKWSVWSLRISSGVQVSRATQWTADWWTLKTVACVVDATDIPPELQLVQWSMLCPLSLPVYDPCILHGYVQQASKQRPPPLAGPNGYPVGGDVLIHAVDSTHVLVILGDDVYQPYTSQHWTSAELSRLVPRRGS